MSIIYFDICSIPLFLIILFICYSRKMTKGAANQLFILLVILSLLSAVTDLGMEICNNIAPLSKVGVVMCSISTYLYLIFRNFTNVALLLFLLALTRTTFLIKSKWARIAFFLPYIGIMVMLVQNPFTHSAFYVTTETGYERGVLMYAFYGIALLYGLVGLVYCVYCYRYLPLHKWGALMSVYILGHAAVLVSFFRPELLLEMFCTAIGEMLIMLSIMRPEERMDIEAGTLSWASYQADLKNIILSGEKVRIAVIRISKSSEIRNYLGDHDYNKFIKKIVEAIRSVSWKHPHRNELYYEKPGNFYLISDTDEIEMNSVRNAILERAEHLIKEFTDIGVPFEPQICFILCPDDLKNADDIINLGHKFHSVDNHEENVFQASDIVKSKSFVIEAHIEEILNRAIKNNNLQLFYQPIYDTKNDCYHAAEALARITDPEYGLISPGIFIPAAETLGSIIPIGDMVLEQAFKFVSEHNLRGLGLSFIEVNLSVAQCVEKSLPDKIFAMQKKYNVDPSQINLEITETTFEDISEIVLDNVNKLIEMGYSFSLDDYGIGYSSVQRVSSIPFKLIKIDKSMVDEASSSSGRMILSHTIKMMQSIGKKLVCEGAETIETIEMLKNMHCDYIQGFYFSKPLPENEFVEFLNKKQ